MPDSAFRIPQSAFVPDFVVCGNVVRDVVPDGWAPGGTAVYAAVVARGLGRRVGVVTAAPEDVVQAALPADVAVARVDTDQATSYENLYTPAGRVQYLRAPGAPIPPETLPAAWAGARVALLGPVYHEVPAALAARFTGSVGVCAQGFLRRAAADGRVSVMPPGGWDAVPVLRHARVLFLSEEDLGGESPEVPAVWLAAVPITVLTAGRRGAQVWSNGRRRHIAACPANEIDPTGAGDTFAAAFMIALDDGANAVEAARFAAAVAAFAVEGPGPQAPTRAAVAARRSPESGVRCPESDTSDHRHRTPDTGLRTRP